MDTLGFIAKESTNAFNETCFFLFSTLPYSHNAKAEIQHPLNKQYTTHNQLHSPLTME